MYNLTDEQNKALLQKYSTVGEAPSLWLFRLKAWGDRLVYKAKDGTLYVIHETGNASQHDTEKPHSLWETTPIVSFHGIFDPTTMTTKPIPEEEYQLGDYTNMEEGVLYRVQTAGMLNQYWLLRLGSKYFWFQPDEDSLIPANTEALANHKLVEKMGRFKATVEKL